MDRLPAEVLLDIIGHLDGPAPSEATRLRDQPRGDMLARPAAACPLKAASRVSRGWRALVLPTLFRHVLWRPRVEDRVAADAAEPPPSQQQRLFTVNPVPLLRFLVEARLDRQVATFTLLVDLAAADESGDSAAAAAPAPAPAHPVNNWLAGSRFFSSWSRDEPARHARAAEAATAAAGAPTILPADLEWLWDQLFAVVDPLRFTLVAQPATLAAFLSRMLFLDEAWAFDMPYHVLSLARPARGPPPPSPPPCPLFTARPWTSVLLNEGSSLKVYRVYEFFLRRPPSMLGALLGCEEYPNDTCLLPSTVVDFSYIAIFPLFSHFETLAQNLPRLERLYLQLTPGPGNRILEDQEGMRRLDPADLWMECNTCYSHILGKLVPPLPGNNPPPSSNWDTLRVFETGDTADHEVWDLAVDLFEQSQTSEWRVEREGLLVRRGRGGTPPLSLITLM
ncbi:hypothetical protein GGR56DRAFT_605043 [Xylariaceae sp. FL0804]|nr:hypothetical protein GGR56DRAFT_605043 [Xylariaceae sp. FL0804]